MQGDVTEIYTSGNLKVKYGYDAYGNCTVLSQTTDTTLANANPIRYRGYYFDTETGLYYLNSRYYNPEWRRFISPDDTAYIDPQTVNGLNLYVYANNNPIDIAYGNSSAIDCNSVGGGLVSSGSTSKDGLNLGWLANGLGAGSTIHGLYISISGLVNHTSYFAKNLAPFMDDMTMIGASMKEGVLAFNQFSWVLGKSDVLGIALGIGLDIYDSIERGVSLGGVVLGATLTAAKGIGLIYLNKGILYGATTIGTAICPGVGTVVGFVVGGVVCIFADIFAGNWLDELINSIAK